MRRPLPALLLLLAIAACRTSRPPSAIEPALAAAVPPGTAAVAGLRLDRLRPLPLFSALRDALPPSPLLDSGRSALLSWNGHDTVVVVRGDFPSLPASALLAPGLAAVGAPSLIAAATAQYRAAPDGPGGAPEFITRGEPLARDWPIWAVVAGGRSLPLSGNAANLNRLLRATDYATATARPNSAGGLDLRITALGRNPVEATKLEETLRAIITLAKGGAARNPALLAVLEAATVDRSDRTVTVNAMLPEPIARTAIDSLVRQP